MENFETNISTPEASPEDVQALAKHLAEQGYENYDDHDAVLKAAGDCFSNYAETDVVAIVTALYHKEQQAALQADEADAA